MSLFSKRKPISATNDVNLVILSLGGDRSAFCEIVSRYQNLLCSLAYSAVGDIKYSEDLAQEAFVEAWKKLDTLKDPEKLKSWLCGILRFKISHYRRKEARQPTKGANDLVDYESEGSEHTHLETAAINEQEQALLWQTLDKMENNYREPLILFYREQQSVERVAAELDLTLATAKQRLSRGRKLLKIAIISLVEETLTKTKPGVGFTAGVLAVISSISPPAKAAVATAGISGGSAVGVSAGFTKTSSLLKLASILTLIATFSGVISSFFGLRASLDQSRTQRERNHAIKVVASFLIFAIIYVAGMFAVKYLALNSDSNLQLYAIISQLLVFSFVASYLWLISRMFAQTRNLRAQERIFNPQAFQQPIDKINTKQREYISKLTLLGTPLFHFQFGMYEVNDKPAVGWFAGGSKAYGVIFAWGGVAIAPVSVGIVTVGIVSVGAVGFGLIGIGTVGIGVISFGASAIGYQAYGSLSALGWESAISGGFSIAKEAAIAPVAYAAQINNAQAAEISNLSLLEQHYQWVLIFIAIIVIIPSIWHSHKVRQRMRKV